jgi:hypothetical protein
VHQTHKINGKEALELDQKVMRVVFRLSAELFEK